MEIPAQLQLGPSAGEIGKQGVWCKYAIKAGTRFGPFLGDKVTQISRSVDNSYVWEIVDQASGEVLFYLDASDHTHSNWMRYVKCAPCLLKQNITSHQEDIDIFFTVTKDISVGDELLTWHEFSSGVRRGRNIKHRRASIMGKVPSPEDKSGCGHSDSDSTHQKCSKVTTARKPTSKYKTPYEKEHSVSQKSKMIAAAVDKWPLEKTHSTGGNSDPITNETVMKKRMFIGDQTLKEHISISTAQRKLIEVVPARKKISNSESEIKEEDIDLFEHSRTEIPDNWLIETLHNTQNKDSCCVDLNKRTRLDAVDFKEGDVCDTQTLTSVKVQPSDDILSDLESEPGGLVIDDSREEDPIDHTGEHTVLDGIRDLQSKQNNNLLDAKATISCDINTMKHSFEIGTHTDESNTVASKNLLIKKMMPLEANDKAHSEDKEPEEDVASIPESTSSTVKSEENRLLAHQPYEPGKFQFELKPEHSEKGRMGKKVFKCDVCSGIYRHAFSLKRHFIRTHVNLCYVTNADMLNCQVNPMVQKCLPSESQLRQYAKRNLQPGNNICQVESSSLGLNSSKQTGGFDMSGGTDQDIKNFPVDNGMRKDYKAGVEICKGKSDRDDNEVVFDKLSDQHGLDKSETGEKVEDYVETKECEGENANAVEIGIEDMLGLYRCNICCHLYDTISDLRMHIVNHPEVPNMKAYSCDKCEMKFSHKQNLMRHHAVHSGAKPYACKVCGKKFPTATNKKRHERIHDGRRIPCDYCTSSFTQTGDLKKHIRKLHPECFFECAFCNKYFNKEKSLAKHLHEHDDSIDCNQIKEMKLISSHHDPDNVETPQFGDNMPGLKFSCTICKKGFHDYANMCRHRRLAHQRHLLISKKTNECEEMCHSPSGSELSDLDPTSYFYANVSRNIADNLNYFVEGNQEHLENSKIYINWKSSTNHEKEKEPALPNQSEKSEESLEKYNFPPGFKFQVNFPTEVQNEDLLSQHRMTRTVLQVPSFHTLESLRQGHVQNVKSSEMSISDVLSKFHPQHAQVMSFNGKASSPSRIVDQSPGNSNSVPVAAIKVPDFKVCSLCRTVFNKKDLYEEHMKHRHKISAIDDEDKITHEKLNQRDIVRLKVQQYITNKQPKLQSDISPNETAMDLTSSTKPYMVDNCGALDLTSPSKKQNDVFVSHTPKTKPDAETIPKSENEMASGGKTSSPIDVLYPNGKKYICVVCHRDYLEFTLLKEHQMTAHPYVHCSHIEVDVSVGATLWQMPNPIGLLNVCSSHVPNIPGAVPEEHQFKCTKCGTSFKTITDLHGHIVECASFEKQEKINCCENNIFSKAFGRMKRSHLKAKMRKTVAHQKVMKAKRIVGLHDSPSRLIPHRRKHGSFHRQHFKAEVIELQTKRRRRTSMELLYNPRNHVRRREMTEILDMHKCRGCGFRFSSISLLERHIKVCTQKERMRNIEVMKPSSVVESHSRQYTCIYCKKMFTYCGSLRKHISNVCTKRKERVSMGMTLDTKWELGVKNLLKAKDLQTVVPESGDEEDNGVRPRRRRGKRKNHKWGSNKKRRTETNPSVIAFVENKGQHEKNSDVLTVKSAKKDISFVALNYSDSQGNHNHGPPDCGKRCAYSNENVDIASSNCLITSATQEIMTREETNEIKSKIAMDKENLVNISNPMQRENMGKHIELNPAQLNSNTIRSKVKKKSKGEFTNIISGSEEVMTKEPFKFKHELKLTESQKSSTDVHFAMSKPNQLIPRIGSMFTYPQRVEVAKSLGSIEAPTHCQIFEEELVCKGSSDLRLECNVASNDTKVYKPQCKGDAKSSSTSSPKTYLHNSNLEKQAGSDGGVQPNDTKPYVILDVQEGTHYYASRFQTPHNPVPITQDANTFKVNGGYLHSVPLDFHDKKIVTECTDKVAIEEKKSVTLISNKKETDHTQPLNKSDLCIKIPSSCMNTTPHSNREVQGENGVQSLGNPDVCALLPDKLRLSSVQPKLNIASSCNQAGQLVEENNVWVSKGLISRGKNTTDKKSSLIAVSKPSYTAVTSGNVVAPISSSIPTTSSPSLQIMSTTQVRDIGQIGNTSMEIQDNPAPSENTLLTTSECNTYQASHPFGMPTHTSTTTHISFPGCNKSPTGNRPVISAACNRLAIKTHQMERSISSPDCRLDQQDTQLGKKIKIITKNKTVHQILLERSSGEAAMGFVGHPDDTTSLSLPLSKGNIVNISPSTYSVECDAGQKRKPGNKKTVSALLSNMTSEKSTKSSPTFEGISDNKVAVVQQTVFTGESVSKIVTPVSSSMSKTVMSDNRIAIVHQTVFTGESVSKVATPVSNTVWKKTVLPKPTSDTQPIPSQNVNQTVLYVQSVVPNSSSLCGNNNVASFNKLDVGKVTNVLNIQNTPTRQIKSSRKMLKSRIKSIAIPKAECIELGSLVSSDALMSKTFGKMPIHNVDDNRVTHISTQNVSQSVFPKGRSSGIAAGEVVETNISTKRMKDFLQNSNDPNIKSKVNLVTNPNMIKINDQAVKTSRVRGKQRIPDDTPATIGTGRNKCMNDGVKPKSRLSSKAGNKTFMKDYLSMAAHGQYTPTFTFAASDYDNFGACNMLPSSKNQMRIGNPLETLAEVATMELHAVEGKRQELRKIDNLPNQSTCCDMTMELCANDKARNYKPDRERKNSSDKTTQSIPSSTSGDFDNQGDVGLKGNGKKRSSKFEKPCADKTMKSQRATFSFDVTPLKKSRLNDVKPDMPPKIMVLDKVDSCGNEIPFNSQETSNLSEIDKTNCIIPLNKVNKTINYHLDMSRSDFKPQMTGKHFQLTKHVTRGGRGHRSSSASGRRGEMLPRGNGSSGQTVKKQGPIVRGKAEMKKARGATGRSKHSTAAVDTVNRRCLKTTEECFSGRRKRKVEVGKHKGNDDKIKVCKGKTPKKNEVKRAVGVITRKSSSR